MALSASESNADSLMSLRQGERNKFMFILGKDDCYHTLEGAITGAIMYLECEYDNPSLRTEVVHVDNTTTKVKAFLEDMEVESLTITFVDFKHTPHTY